MNDTELAVATIDWMELIGSALYDYDLALAGGEMITGSQRTVSFGNAAPEIRQQYHGRALAAMNAKLQ